VNGPWPLHPEAVAFSEDDRWIAIGRWKAKWPASDPAVQVWDARSGQLAWNGKVDCPVKTLAVSSSNSLVLAVQQRGHIWSLAAELRLQEIKPAQPHTGAQALKAVWGLLAHYGGWADGRVYSITSGGEGLSIAPLK